MFIELQTGAFTRTIKCNKGTTFQLIGTLGALENITFEQPDGSGGWNDIYIDSDQILISSTNTIVSVAFPALIRVNKPATAAAAGILLVS